MIRRIALCLMLSLLFGCATEKAEYNYPEKDKYGRWTRRAEPREERETVFGKGGLDIFGRSKDKEGPGGAGIGVNSFLWRATLDTLAFMPLQSADPFGGVIITDWHAPEGASGERFKINAYIMDKALRADGIRLSVFRQVKDDGTWVDASVSEKTATRLEDAILTRARQLRMNTAAAK